VTLVEGITASADVILALKKASPDAIKDASSALMDTALADTVLACASAEVAAALAVAACASALVAAALAVATFALVTLVTIFASALVILVLRKASPEAIRDASSELIETARADTVFAWESAEVAAALAVATFALVTLVAGALIASIRVLRAASPEAKRE